MTNLVNIPSEDYYIASLTGELANSSGDLIVYVSKAPDFTFPVGSKVYFTINPKKGFTKEEVVLVESYDSVNKTLTITPGGRAQARYNGDSPTPLTHIVGSKIIITDPYAVWSEIKNAVNSKADSSNPVFSGSITVPTYLNAAARDIAIPVPVNGMEVYLTTEGEYTDFTAGAWVVRAAGGSVVNASETVAGKVEQATLLEQGTQVEFGGTGAPLFINPKNTTKTSNGAADENKIPILNASGQFPSGFINGAGLVVQQAQISLPAGEAVDGSTTPQAVYISDGTNGRTLGRFYKADADDTTNMAINIIGFVTVNASVVGTSYSIITNGVVNGFPALTFTAGRPVYLNTTAGGVTQTPPNPTVPVGRAVSATQLLLDSPGKTIYATYTFAASSFNQTIDTTLSLGFQPRMLMCHFAAAASVSLGWWVKGMSGGVWHETSFSGSSFLQFGGLGFIGRGQQIAAATSSTSLTVLSDTDTTITIRRVQTDGTNDAPGGSVYLGIYG